MKRGAAIFFVFIFIFSLGFQAVSAQETVVIRLSAAVFDQPSFDSGPSYSHVKNVEIEEDLIVFPGQAIHWSIWVQVTSDQNEGLAMVSVDLVQDESNPEKFDVSPATGVPPLMTNFSRPAGISNPGEGGETRGYLGVQRGTPGELNLVQIGGAQNTTGTALAAGVGENASVVTGVGKDQEILMAHGSFTAPLTSGDYTFRIENGRANVLELVYEPPSPSDVGEALVTHEADTITFHVAEFRHTDF